MKYKVGDKIFCHLEYINRTTIGTITDLSLARGEYIVDYVDVYNSGEKS